MESQGAPVHEDGHEWLYRVTATGEWPESKYYSSAHQAQFWRDQLRETGYTAQAARVPASAFTELTDGELDALAYTERAEAQRQGGV